MISYHPLSEIYSLIIKKINLNFIHYLRTTFQNFNLSWKFFASFKYVRIIKEFVNQSLKIDLCFFENLKNNDFFKNYYSILFDFI